MLNGPPHRRAHANLTVRKIPEGIAESHLGIQHHPSSRVAGFGIRSNGMNLMRADRCADVSKVTTALERKHCHGFMSAFCHPTPGRKESAGAAAQSLCAKFYAALGPAGHVATREVAAGHVAFHLDGARDTGESTPPLWQLVGSPMSPAPVSQQPASPAPAAYEREKVAGTDLTNDMRQVGAVSPAPAEAADEDEESTGPEFVIQNSNPGPAPAPAPGPGPPRAQFGKINGMDENVLMPEQGFSGRLVAHDDAHTHVADWQTEYGPKANLKSVEDICAKYPHNRWCVVNNYRAGHRMSHPPPEVEKEEAFDPLDPEHHVKRATDTVDSIKDWMTGEGGEDSGTTAEPWHEGFKDVFRAPEGDGKTSSGSGEDGYSSDVPDVGKIEKAEDRRETPMTRIDGETPMTPIFGSPGTPKSGARRSASSWWWRQLLPWALGLLLAFYGC